MHRSSGSVLVVLCLCLANGCGDSAKPAAPAEPAAVSSSAEPKPAADAVATPDPSTVIYKALGNEPFWHVDVRASELQLFEMADLRAVAPKYTVEEHADGREYKSPELRLKIRYAPCSDGMSDRKYPHTAQVEYGKGSFTGCGWPAGYDLGPPP